MTRAVVLSFAAATAGVFGAWETLAAVRSRRTPGTPRWAGWPTSRQATVFTTEVPHSFLGVGHLRFFYLAATSPPVSPAWVTVPPPDPHLPQGPHARASAKLAAQRNAHDVLTARPG